MSDEKEFTVMSLANKYRPKRLEDLCGQQAVIDVIKGALGLRQPNSSYLFEGGTGLGKTTTARIFARYLNCDTFDACGKCRNCKAFDQAGGHPDLTEVNFSESRGIDDVRSVVDKSVFKPRLGRFRIVICDEIQGLTPQAQAAFLKPLEEPTAQTVFLLCSMSSDKVDAAILGRVTRLKLTNPTREQVVEFLGKVVDSEMETHSSAEHLTDEILGKIAEYTRGHMRNALQALQALLAVAHANDSLPEEAMDALLGEHLGRVEGIDDVKRAVRIWQGIHLGVSASLINPILDTDKDWVRVAQVLSEINTYILSRAQMTVLTCKGNPVTEFSPIHATLWKTQECAMAEKVFGKMLATESGDIEVLIPQLIFVQEKLVDFRKEVMQFAVPERHLALARLMAIAQTIKDKFLPQE